MKTSKKIAFLLFITFLTSSCEDFFVMDIDLDIPAHESKLAVTSFLSNNNEETNRVLVSYSIGGLEQASDNQLINDATVTLSIGNTDYLLNNTEQDGIYKLENIIDFSPNSEYSLTVESGNFTAVTASQIFPETVNITEATITDKLLKVRFHDKPNVKNYYILTLEAFNNTNDVYTDIWSDDESTFKWSSIKSNGLVFNDETFDGEDKEITVSYSIYANNEEESFQLKAILYNITEDVYRYDLTKSLAEDAEYNPFTEPVILHRNFENGYGIFGMMNQAEYEIQFD